MRNVFGRCSMPCMERHCCICSILSLASAASNDFTRATRARLQRFIETMVVYASNAIASRLISPTEQRKENNGNSIWNLLLVERQHTTNEYAMCEEWHKEREREYGTTIAASK